MKQEIVVTSYRRLKYLKPSIGSIRANSPEMRIIIADGGSNEETVDFIKANADEYVLLEGNPGADVLKNEGIGRVTMSHFFITSDDYLYPPGWAETAWSQFELLNAGLAKRGKQPCGMLACPTDLVIERHTQEPGHGRGCGMHYFDTFGIWYMPTSVAMVAGTIMNREGVLACEGFPVYGKSGQGDIAISRRLHRLGFEVGYLRTPVLNHLGENKAEDYPDYTKMFDDDDAIYQALARKDDWRPGK